MWKTSPNWEKNIKDGLQNFQHIIFNGKCWTDRLDLSMNENRNLFYGLRGVSLIFCGKFGAWELPNSYQKPWEMGWQQFYRFLEYLEKNFFLRVKNHFGGSIRVNMRAKPWIYCSLRTKQLQHLWYFKCDQTSYITSIHPPLLIISDVKLVF